MTQQVQELIDKIKQEGVHAAEQKAAEIEAEAKRKAEETVNKAKREAEKILNTAKEEVKKLKESTHASLQQAARDTVLSLRQEVERILQRLVRHEVAESLTGEHLARILEAVATGALKGDHLEADIRITVSQKDLHHLEKGLLSKLQKQIKHPIKLQASDDIAHGFTISYDGGRSCFDFSDASLAQFLGSFVNSQVSALIKESV